MRMLFMIMLISGVSGAQPKPITLYSQYKEEAEATPRDKVLLNCTSLTGKMEKVFFKAGNSIAIQDGENRFIFYKDIYTAHNIHIPDMNKPYYISGVNKVYVPAKNAQQMPDKTRFQRGEWIDPLVYTPTGGRIDPIKITREDRLKKLSQKIKENFPSPEDLKKLMAEEAQKLNAEGKPNSQAIAKRKVSEKLFDCLFLEDDELTELVYKTGLVTPEEGTYANRGQPKVAPTKPQARR